MKNFIAPGNSLDWRNRTGADVTSGTPVPLGAVVGVASGDTPADGDGVLKVAGAFDLPKAGGSAWQQGDALSWDSDAGAFRPDRTLTPASGDVRRCAFAILAAGSAATVGLACLKNPGDPVA
jgi:predicted RecA/RadA family phage recombinase